MIENLSNADHRRACENCPVFALRAARSNTDRSAAEKAWLRMPDVLASTDAAIGTPRRNPNRVGDTAGRRHVEAKIDDYCTVTRREYGGCTRARVQLCRRALAEAANAANVAQASSRIDTLRCGGLNGEHRQALLATRPAPAPLPFDLTLKAVPEA